MKVSRTLDGGKSGVCARRLVLLAVACAVPLSTPANVAAQSSPPHVSVARTKRVPADSAAPRHWTVRIDYQIGRPTGWVQVRENRIDGTHLSFGPGLGIHSVSTLGLTLTKPAGSGTVGLAVTGTTLRGSVLLTQPVYFNGSTLRSGTVLRTRTEAGDFLRVVIDYEHRLARIGTRGELTGRAGLDATLLNFRLKGTLDSSTVGHETKEDFVTQELPTPFLGLELKLPVGRRTVLHVGGDGGGLPWVSSFRYEGGLVSLTQRRLDADAGVDVALASRLAVGLGVHSTSFTQYEQSHEDGNEISLASTSAVVSLTWAF